MARTARVVIPGLPHHITQRGNYRQQVFFSDEDRDLYLRILRKQTRKHQVNVVAYCLMTNHVHIVAVPKQSDGLARAIGQTHHTYSYYLNELHERTGHLWQNRFFSCPLDARHLFATVRYVERNPVRAGIVRSPWKHPWSSAHAHCGDIDAAGLVEPGSWHIPPQQWKERLTIPDHDRFQTKLRQRTSDGRPLGSDDFVTELEERLGRRLRPPVIGRPARSGQIGAN